MSRVVVIGHSCAGKSTVARVLAERRGLRWIDLDAIHYGPDWQMRSLEEKQEILASQLALGEPWIIDGLSSFMFPVDGFLPDEVVWVHVSRTRSAARIITRTLRRWLTRERVCGGNLERPWSLVTKDSLLFFVLRVYANNQAKYQRFADSAEQRGAKVRRFDSLREALAWAHTGSPD